MTIRFTPTKFSYLVRELTPIEARERFPLFEIEPRKNINTDKIVPTRVVQIIKTGDEKIGDGEYNEEAEFDSLDYCVAELDASVKVYIGDREFHLITIDDILGKIEEV